MGIKAVFLLLLVTYDYDTGDLLQKEQIILEDFTWQQCMNIGIEKADAISEYWRTKGFDNASTNVKCDRIEPT